MPQYINRGANTFSSAVFMNVIVKYKMGGPTVSLTQGSVGQDEGPSVWGYICMPKVKLQHMKK